MLDFNTLPLTSKIILVTGFAIGIASFGLYLRYVILLILMKYRPEYREFIKKSGAKNKKYKKFS